MPSWPPLPSLAAAGAVAGLACAVWLASLARRDVSLVDRFWPWLVAVPALVAAGSQAGSLGARGGLVLALLLAWALRLSIYLSWRNWGHGEDRRYAAMRAARGPAFAWQSLYVVFGLQAALALVVGLPTLAALAGPGVLDGWDVPGGALVAFGIVFSGVADAQLARFLAGPRAEGAVMDRGLWRWSRHPNYFGEACVWWGFWVLACSAGVPGAVGSVVSPLLMTWLLLRVSGVVLLEKDMAGRRPAYRDYVARTSAFVPWPPRRAARG